MKTGTITKNGLNFTNRAHHQVSATPPRSVKVNILCPLAARNIKSLLDGHSPALPVNARREDLERNVFEVFIDLFCHMHPMCLRHLMETIEAGIIRHILDETHGNQRKTAKLLGIKYTTLNTKVKKYHIQHSADTIMNLFALEGREPDSPSEH